MGLAGQRWADELAAWAIPPEILAVAPEPPWFFPPAVFTPPDVFVDNPSRIRAREALGDGGSVLDVGCGGGAAGLALVPPATRVVGFDQGRDLLDVFESKAGEMGVDYEVIQGSWPDDAAQAPTADVVVSHHVVYNVADLAAFAHALTSAARRRVVVEMTAVHPLTRMTPLWRHFWGIDRPQGPTAHLAMEVLAESGLNIETERATRPPMRELPHDQHVAFIRRRLCLTPDRDAEIESMLPDIDSLPLREAVTIWWDGAAT